MHLYDSSIVCTKTEKTSRDIAPLTVPCKENFGGARYPKYRSHEETGWTPEYYHLAVSCHGYGILHFCSWKTRRMKTLVALQQGQSIGDREKALYLLNDTRRVWLGLQWPNLYWRRIIL